MSKNIAKYICVLFVMSIVLTMLSSCSRNKTDEKLEYNTLDDGTVEITSYTDLTTRTQIDIPDEIDGKPVVRVCDFGVFNSESIKKIVIGKNVKEIGTWAFTNNQGLVEYEVNPENTAFTSVDGVLFTKDMKTLVFYPPAKNISFDKYKTALTTTTYIIPDGVETIRSKAFYKCYYVTDISIPDSVTTIEEKAFHKATGLKEINLPQNLKFIGKDAFSHCNLVKSITVPANVTEIDEYAFYNCTGVETLTMLCKESNMKLGKKWYPTNNGREIKNLKTEWK